VAKAYTTRVGKVPFPTTRRQHSTNHLCDRHEFGTTTGVAVVAVGYACVIGRYAVESTASTAWRSTKLDVLANLIPIQVTGVAYELDGERASDHSPAARTLCPLQGPIYCQACRGGVFNGPIVVRLLRQLSGNGHGPICVSWAELMEVPIAIVSHWRPRGPDHRGGDLRSADRKRALLQCLEIRKVLDVIARRKCHPSMSSFRATDRFLARHQLHKGACLVMKPSRAL